MSSEIRQKDSVFGPKNLIGPASGKMPKSPQSSKLANSGLQQGKDNSGKFQWGIWHLGIWVKSSPAKRSQCSAPGFGVEWRGLRLPNVAVRAQPLQRYEQNPFFTNLQSLCLPNLSRYHQEGQTSCPVHLIAQCTQHSKAPSVVLSFKSLWSWIPHLRLTCEWF